MKNFVVTFVDINRGVAICPGDEVQIAADGRLVVFLKSEPQFMAAAGLWLSLNVAPLDAKAKEG